MNKVVLLPPGLTTSYSDSIASSRQTYTLSDAARAQRQNNGLRKRWVNNLKVLSEKLSWKVEESKLVNEIIAYIEQAFTFEQLADIFSEDYETLIASRLEKCAEEAVRQAKASCDETIDNLAKEVDKLEGENDSLREEIKNMVSKKKLQRVNNDNVRLNQEIGKLQRNIVLLKGNIKGKKS
jgi:predicted RNase H-like nuclease (RuvC/YqgF family)